MVATDLAAKRGILFKQAVSLEQASKIQAIVFDRKSRTLLPSFTAPTEHVRTELRETLAGLTPASGSDLAGALAAARALVDGPLDAEAIVRRSLDIAADICVYTNRNVTIETLSA